jgi:large subunit ribosomal protein L10
MKLADLESREVLLAKLAGAMKGSLAKAIRTIDALRAKKEASEGAPAPVAVAEAPAPVVEAAVEDVQAAAETNEAEVPAVAETEASAPAETPEA